VKMRIRDALASETDRVRAAPSAKRASQAEGRRHLRVGYILAVTWVIVALSLYAFQMVRLAAGRA
jgi:hypothetical protein